MAKKMEIKIEANGRTLNFYGKGNSIHKQEGNLIEYLQNEENNLIYLIEDRDKYKVGILKHSGPKFDPWVREFSKNEVEFIELVVVGGQVYIKTINRNFQRLLRIEEEEGNDVVLRGSEIICMNKYIVMHIRETKSLLAYNKYGTEIYSTPINSRSKIIRITKDFLLILETHENEEDGTFYQELYRVSEEETIKIQ